MSSFFRYYRPVFYDQKLGKAQVKPTGGITFCCEGDVNYNISYAICHVNDVFSKETGKVIASTRFENGHKFQVYTWKSGANWIADKFLQMKESKADSPSEFYQLQDLQLLKQTILEIRKTEREVQFLLDLNADIARAMNIRDRYLEISK